MSPPLYQPLWSQVRRQAGERYSGAMPLEAGPFGVACVSVVGVVILPHEPLGSSQ